MKLQRKYLEKYNPCTRDIQDQRKKISKAVFSYTDDNNNEYRKSFKDIPYKSEQYFWSIAPITMNV